MTLPPIIMIMTAILMDIGYLWHGDSGVMVGHIMIEIESIGGRDGMIMTI
jgi:hypothetical protein